MAETAQILHEVADQATPGAHQSSISGAPLRSVPEQLDPLAEVTSLTHPDRVRESAPAELSRIFSSVVALRASEETKPVGQRDVALIERMQTRSDVVLGAIPSEFRIDALVAAYGLGD